MLQLFRTIYEFFVPCPESRGHNYGPVSDLCLNEGCEAGAGSWEWCKSKDARPKPRGLTITIEITNLKEAHAIAIEDMLATWQHLGNIGSSRWTAFFADGDGDFRPKIMVNDHKPQVTDLIPRPSLWETGDYKIDFDNIAYRLREQKEHGIS